MGVIERFKETFQVPSAFGLADGDALRTRLDSYILQGTERAALFPPQVAGYTALDAAEAWAYYLAYTDLLNHYLNSPDNVVVNNTGEIGHFSPKDRITAYERLRDSWRDKFSEITATPLTGNGARSARTQSRKVKVYW